MYPTDMTEVTVRALTAAALFNRQDVSCLNHGWFEVITYKVGSIHDAILHRVSAVQGELQDLLLPLPTLLPDHLLFLAQTLRGLTLLKLTQPNQSYL